MTKNLQLIHICVLLLLALLYGCNGGSQSETNPQTTSKFSGTVSTTKRLAEQTVFIKTMQGDYLTADIDDHGRFVLEDANRGDHFLMRVDLGNGNFLYSLAHLTLDTGNRQNIHSYTDLAARTWFADLGLNINVVFASNNGGIENFPDAEDFQLVDSNIQAVVSDVLEVYGLSDTNLSTADYQNSDTGVDRFLDENPVIISDNRATIIVHDPLTSMQSTAVNRVALQTTFGEIDNTPPDQPTGLRANGTNDNEIVLAWTVASDNIGIATYEIYRNDALVGHTPFPLFRDTALAPDTDYAYTIVAVDESSNRSIPSVTAEARVLDAPDLEAPVAPSRTYLVADIREINLSWNHNNLPDLARFETIRTSDDGILVRDVTSPAFTDITVSSGTQYCYTVVAIDASGNRSDPNPQACITTSGEALDSPDSIITPATISMARETLFGREGSKARIFIERSGDLSGEISIDYSITPGTATATFDYYGVNGTLVWSDGDGTSREITVDLVADNIVEENETFSVVLSNASINAVITGSSTLVTIVDN